jgi:hypothetical protein
MTQAEIIVAVWISLSAVLLAAAVVSYALTLWRTRPR